MAILLGTRLGPYEILSPIGAGGMGEVYKARDTRLDRIVAVKVLPTHLADRSELRERFEREAKTIASLNHPHICTLYDTGHQDDVDFLVMEYIEGETLAQRLQKGALPIQQVFQYAIEISDALDKAHRNGVTHRDLKPGNIMLTKSGTKLLDFGLAKLAKEASPANVHLTELPTAKDPLTAQGTLIGTLQYMDPEQVEGKEVDARTDIFAFGAVMYEMTTGKRAFEGKTQASLIAKILEIDPPPISSLQPMTPPALDRVVRRCLAKDPDDRWQTVHDLNFELGNIGETSSHSLEQQPAFLRKWTKDRVGVLAVVAVVAIATLGIAYVFRHSSGVNEEKNVSTLSVLPPAKASFSVHNAPLVSPNGRLLAFVATLNGDNSLWIRDMNSLEARAVPGTEGLDDAAGEPFWSPDSRFLAFFAKGKLKKVSVAGGPVLSLCDAALGRGGSWSQNDVIVFAPNDRSGLFSVPASGGMATLVTEPDPALMESSHRLPWFLPDGHHFLYTAWSTPQNTAIYVGELESRKRHRVLTAFSNAVYASGRLLFMRGRTLMAQPFDVGKEELTGEPLALAQQVDYSRMVGTQGLFSSSQNGILAYSSNEGGSLQLTWFDRSGRARGTVGSPELMTTPRISPDSGTVAIARFDTETGFANLWSYDLARGTASRFTADAQSIEINPVWSPQGDRIAFSSNRDGAYKLYVKDTRSGAKETPLDVSGYNKQALDWSRDGRYVVEGVNDPVTGFDIWVLPLFGDWKPFPYLLTEFGEIPDQLSPDGRWLAYDSDETRRWEVYVDAFPTPGSKHQISINGGSSARWSRDGKELYFVGLDGKMMAVVVRGGDKFEAGLPVPLFDTKLNFNDVGFDVSTDGRFLIPTQVREPGTLPITVMVNWPAGLKKR
jgi:serine/threonine protein kinase